MLDVGAAAVAALPALGRRERGGGREVAVLGAGGAAVLRVAAVRAGGVALGAARHGLGGVDLRGADEEAAARLAAVDALGDREVPLLRPLAVLELLIGLDVGGDRAFGDGVETALGRPVLLVLAGGGDEAAEAGLAVVVAGGFDGVFRVEIV